MARVEHLERPVRGLTSARLGRSESPRGVDREWASRGIWASETIARDRDRHCLLELSRADEKPGQKADIQPGHVLANRIPSPLESIDQLFELLLAIRLTLPSGFEGRGYLVDVLDVFSDRLLLGLDMLQSPVDAVGKTAELLFCEPPFFASKFRWIESRTSFKASAMSRPGGWRGPPWSLLRIPRTAAQ